MRTEIENSLENRNNALTDKIVSRKKAHRVKTQAKILTTIKNGEEIQEDAFTNIVETKNIIIFRVQKTSGINMKDDMEIIIEETVEEETILEETIIEGTIAAFTLTVTTEILTFNNTIIKMWKLR